jgi:hypothetical protein
MGSKAFISYSHRDEKFLDRLHKHLAMLRREGAIDVWVDRRIEAGGKIDKEVAGALESSDLFLALVSPDFLDSNYCYEQEMQSALARSVDGSLRIVPIILEPCDWQASPLSQFKALPKDGHPISLWSNENVALLDIVTELRKLLTTHERHEPRLAGTEPSVRRFKVKREFDAIDKAEFRDAAFETIRSFFEASIKEINQVGEPLKARFEQMSQTAFTCTIVNRAKRDGEAHITVHNQKKRGLGDLTYNFSAHAESGSANGMANIEVDEFQLFLRLDSFARQSERKLTADEVARVMWADFMQRAGIEYE